MGKLFKSKTQTTQQPFESNPWKPQQPFLEKGLSAGGAALDKALATNGSISDFTADMTPEQIAALRAGGAFSMDAGNSGRNLMSLGMGAAGSLSDYTTNSANLVRDAGADRTDTILNNASRFADNPALQGQIDAALGDVRKAFDRNVGDINSGASATGNINSTRAGTLEAYAQDDAMDRAAAISSGMRGDAWNRGVELASGNLSDQFSQALGANSQLGQAAGMGVDTAGAGYNLGAGAFGDAYGMSSEFQKQAQAEIDGLRAKGMSDLDIVNQYMATVGGNFGSQGFQTSVQQKPSVFQQLVGGASSLLGAWGGLKRG